MKDVIFHQAYRYELAKWAIEALRTETCHKILEVGSGAHGNLAKYLPADEITFLDNTLPDEVLADKRFVKGDATCLPFEDESFDFVIALDVIEHIPAELREEFVKNITRVCKKGIFIIFPHFCETNPYADSILKAFYTMNKSEVPIWIDEHNDCVLPQVDEVKNMFAKYVEEQRIFYQGCASRSLSEKLLALEAICSNIPELMNFFEPINSEYVRTIMKRDVSIPIDEALKVWFFISKESSGEEAKNNFLKNIVDDCQTRHAFEDRVTVFLGWAQSLILDEKMRRMPEQNAISTYKYMEVMQGSLLNSMDKLADIKEGILDKKISGLLEIIDERINIKYNLLDEKINGLLNSVDKLVNPLESDAKVNVILITYNHSTFVEKALRSILEQITDFKYNIIVADDCSQDDTVEIIKNIEKETDVEFVYLPNNKNLGIMKNYKRAFEACNGKYVAILEGDDFWTNAYRLQKMVDFLDAHYECSMAFSRYKVMNFEKGKAHVQPMYGAEDIAFSYKYVTGHDLAYDNLIGNFSTCVYRKECLAALPKEIYDMRCYDWLLNILMSRMGPIVCLMQVMSVYRIHEKGVWSGQDRLEQLQDLVALIDNYNEYTEYEFTEGFTAHKERLLEMIRLETVKDNLPEVVTKDGKLKSIIKKVLKIK